MFALDEVSQQTATLRNLLAKKNKYADWSKEELVKRVEALEKRKKYGLVWDEERTKEKFEADAEGKLPVLKEVKTKEIKTDPDKPTHILIEGDNYHALSVLSYTHEKSIDVIYIDPPYNTGNQSWKYNNAYVERDDAFKHSKWLSFMYKRLLLAKRLLKKDGALIVAIDDYEVHHLALILEDIFSNFERDLIIVEHHPQGAGSNTVSRTHEYAFVCTPPNVGFKGRAIRREEGNWSLKRTGQGENNWRVNRPKQFYCIVVDEEKRQVVGVGPEIPKDVEAYPSGKTDDGFLRIYPLDREGKERVWRYNRPSMLKLIDEGNVQFTPKGSLVLKKSTVNAVPVFSVWQGSRFNAGTYGSSLLTKIMGKANTFPYPKSLYAVIDMLSLIVRNNPSAVVLDFFAGSGTTGQAVLEINKDDKGNRQFILCTNNEGNICEEVCYPRLRKILSGFQVDQVAKRVLLEKRITLDDLKNSDILLDKIEQIKSQFDLKEDQVDIKVEEGILKVISERENSREDKPSLDNLKYYRTSFVPSEPTDRNKELLTKEAVEMLCLRENTFDLVSENENIKIYRNKDRYTGIIFDQLSIPKFKKTASKFNKSVSVYVFSLGDDDFSDEFADMKKVKVCSIPEAILRVYRRIFK